MIKSFKQDVCSFDWLGITLITGKILPAGNGSLSMVPKGSQVFVRFLPDRFCDIKVGQ
jgi:hypothetical protein